jgi:hypothetical protein
MRLKALVRVEFQRLQQAQEDCLALALPEQFVGEDLLWAVV